MIRKTLAFAAALPLLAAPAPLAAQGGHTFTVELTGAAERPGPGDPDGSGTATIEVNPGQGTVCYSIEVENITLPATGAHIHRAPATTFGGIVVPLEEPDATGTSSGCAENLLRSLLVDIIRNPEAYYINVHTLPLYGAGAVRGQLDRRTR